MIETVNNKINGMTGRLLRIIQSVTFTNVLILMMIVAIALPTWFAYRFITDPEVRSEFWERGNLINFAPCLVLKTSTPQFGGRYTIGYQYGVTPDLMQRILARRSGGDLTQQQIDDTCRALIEESKTLER